MKNFSEFIEEKESPYKKETLKKYKEKYEKGEEIPFGVKTSMIAQGIIPHEGGPLKGKKKKTKLYEAKIGEIDPSINVNQIIYGNTPIEYVEFAQDPNDTIKNWFIEKGLIEKIKSEAPANDSETTKKDFLFLLETISKVTAEDITFARYADEEQNLPNLFIDLLKSKGYEETMGDYFRVDNQTDSILNFLKDVINRPRPYQLARYYNYPLYPLIRTNAMTASYPSGHALTAFVMSEYYSKKYPSIEKELKELAENIAQSRIKMGLHYPSDTEISREISRIIFENNLIS